MMTPERLRAFCALSSAASRFNDLPYGSVARADMYATLADLRTAHTLACGDVTVDDVDPTVGILTAAASVRLYGRERRR